MPTAAPGELAALRQLLLQVLPTAAQLRAFCARHFPSAVLPGGEVPALSVTALSSSVLPGEAAPAPSVTALVDQLLARVTVAEVRYRLELEQPALVAQHTDYALQVADPLLSVRPLRQGPPRDPAFSGRAEQLGMLHGLLARHRAVVITGPSGVGKTALATEFLHRAGAGYAVSYLLDATLPESLGAALGELVRHLQEHGFLTLPASATVELAIAAGRDFLTRRADWLLVVDGVRSLGEVESLLGSGAPAGQVIYTTAGEVAAGHAVLAPGPLSDAEALQLLARRSDRHRLLPGERLAVQRLAAALGYWPAALCRVADAVRQSGLTWIEALAQLTATAVARAKAG